MYCMNKLNDGDVFCSRCGKKQETNLPGHILLPGTILNGKYAVGEMLGEGGFGITYMGRDIKLDRIVAIKEYYPTGLVNRSNTISPIVSENTAGLGYFSKGCDRFLKEARILAKFSDEPGIVNIIEFFEENNTAYIVMEYINGITLQEYLKQKGKLAQNETLAIMMPIMRSLEKVHTQGLIHRDISPSNIMLKADQVKLIDFGAARNSTANDNKSISLMLKPGYAPEEQYRSKGVQGPWTDVYALCATMYRCITGITPDEANDRVYSDELKSPSALGITIDSTLEHAVMKGLAVFQKDRYQNIQEFINGLRGIESAEHHDEIKTIQSENDNSEDAKDTKLMEKEEQPHVAVEQAKNVSQHLPVQPIIPGNTPENSNSHKESVSQNLSAQPVISDVSIENKSQKNKKTFMIAGVSVAAVLVVVAVVLLASGVFNKNVPVDTEIESSVVSDNSVELPDDLFADINQNSVKEVETTSEPSKEESSKLESSKDVSEQSSKVVSEVSKTTYIPPELSDNLFDCQIMIDGVVYELPMKYSDFISLGWTPDENSSFDPNDSVMANTSGTTNGYSAGGWFEKNNYRVNVDFFNYSKVNKPISECYINNIMIIKGIDKNNDDQIILPKGITFNVSGENDIINAYGKPNKYTAHETTARLEYWTSIDNNSYKRIWFDIDSEKDVVDDITIINEEKPEDFMDYDTPTTIPEEAKNYVAPTELGTDVISGVVKFHGDLYQFPAPLSAFLNNGWSIKTSEQDYISANSKLSVTIARNDETTGITLYNHSSDSIQLKYGLVASIREIYMPMLVMGYKPEKTEPKMILPNNIYLSMSNTELEKALNKINYMRDIGDYFTKYYIPIEKYTEEEMSDYWFSNYDLPEECRDFKKYIIITVTNKDQYVSDMELNMEK